jgi:hypothetical protein
MTLWPNGKYAFVFDSIFALLVCIFSKMILSDTHLCYLDNPDLSDIYMSDHKAKPL